jgi:predicted esterase
MMSGRPGGRATGKGKECLDMDEQQRKRRVPLPSAVSETQCMRDTQGRPRCFCITEPKRALEPRPVILMHHGHGVEAAKFCIGPMRQAAAVRGVVLVCTTALNGSWQLPHIANLRTIGVGGESPADGFGPIAPTDALRHVNPMGFDGCEVSRSPDLEYVASIVGFLQAHPRRFDVRRIFQAGFSQGAIFAAYASFCLRQMGVPVAGFAQARRIP